MQNLDKKQLVIIIAIVILIVTFIASRSSDDNAAINTPTEDQTNEKIQKPIEQIAAKPPTSTSPKIDTTEETVQKPEPEQTCVPRETFNHDPRHRIVANFIKNDYLAGEIDYINYLNNDELEQLARNRNIKAMYILGINYQWNAVYESDRSERFRPQEIEKQPIKARTEFNKKSFQKAQYWLEKAATHGQVSALIDIAVGYQQQAYLIEEKGEYSEKVVNHIKQNAIAYMQLHQQLAPELSQRTEIDTLVAQLGKPDPALLRLLQRRWKKEREDLGLSEQLELNLPPELSEINDLRANLCP